MDHLKLNLPLEEPVLIFSIILFVIFFSPIIFSKIKIPGIVGLILSGVALGPNGFHILENDSSFKLFGKVGLLYIMFMAGLEIDMNEFKKNSGKSLLFGLLTFLIPMSLGTFITYYLIIELIGLNINTVENFDFESSVLLASMFASHTLIAYPIISRMGISKIETVSVTVGGTIITDTLALLVLAIITSAAGGDLDQEFWIRLGVSLLIFGISILVGFPILGRWFFKKAESEGVAQYIFVLALVFLAAFLALLAGVEDIIGAFLAGLGLNRLIPHTSSLMNKIEFVGNALFIPFFLIGVGMLVDLSVLFKGPQALIIATMMIGVAISSKWLAAFFTQKLLGWNKDNRQLMFGLSSAQAAATLAAVMVGFRMGLLNEAVLNGTILMILVTCLVASIAAENSGKKIAIVENEKLPEVGQLSQRLLIPLDDKNPMNDIIDFAILMKDKKSKEDLYTLTVVKDDSEAAEKMLLSKKMLEKAELHAAETETSIKTVIRVDYNVSSGILRAVKELFITNVILGWNGKYTTENKIFGTILDSAIRNSEKMFTIIKITKPVNTIKRLFVIVPQNAEYEIGFQRWINDIFNVAMSLGCGVVFYGHPSSFKKLKDQVRKKSKSTPVDYKEFGDLKIFSKLRNELKNDDFVIAICARKRTLSYQYVMDQIPSILSNYFIYNDFAVIYPEQNKMVTEGDVSDLADNTILEENIRKISQIGKIFTRRGE